MQHHGGKKSMQDSLSLYARAAVGERGEFSLLEWSRGVRG